MTEQIASLIVEKGAEIAMPPRSNPKVGYRFELDGEIVEILGPDRLKSDPQTPRQADHLSGCRRYPGAPTDRGGPRLLR